MASTVKLKFPVAATGVPLIEPSVDSDKPCGSPPEMILQVYGAVPPVAFSCSTYGTLNVAGGSGALLVMVTAACAIAGVRTSVDIAKIRSAFKRRLFIVRFP